jgi:hypothetical protein
VFAAALADRHENRVVELLGDLGGDPAFLERSDQVVVGQYQFQLAAIAK